MSVCLQRVAQIDLIAGVGILIFAHPLKTAETRLISLTLLILWLFLTSQTFL